jgi:RNA polymerase sigma-70 factor (ECF subfamily)
MSAVSASSWGDAEQKVRRVYHLCFRMTLDAKEAERACAETFERALAGGARRPEDDRACELWLLKIAAHVLEARLPPLPEVSFDLLDETLRSEATRTEEVSSLTNPQRELLLWELKQGCMTAVANCLAPGERIAFLATASLGLSDEEAALALGISPSALKVRLSRARKKVGDYLAPRCGHIDPRNPCQCPSRIGVALRKGFIAPPASSEVRLRKLPAFDEGRRLRDAVSIFGTLPEPDPPEPLLAHIVASLASGRWQSLA